MNFKKSKWISVDDQLPPDNMWIGVTEFSVIPSSNWKGFYAAKHSSSEHRWIRPKVFDNSIITHWILWPL
jgi:hypothetical protein